jgi:uncharacterized membrane protein YeaQ/YmgE (transglycosylase-associated protein family)
MNSQMATGRERSERRKDVIGRKERLFGAEMGRKTPNPEFGARPWTMTLKGFSCEGRDADPESGAEDLMSGVGVFATAVIGILAGWIADLALGRRHSLFVKLLIGVIGSFIGVFIAQRLDLPFTGFWGGLLVSSVGAVLFLAVLGLVIRRPA